MNIEAPCALRKFKKLRRSILDKSCSKKSRNYKGRGTQHRPDIQEAGYCQTDRKEIYGPRHSSEKRAGKERLPYYLYDTYVEEEYRHGKDLRKIFMEIKGKGFPGSLTPFYDHYGYLSDGHHGHRSGQEVEKMKQRPNCDREPLLPIRQIAHIADKSIRKEKMVHAEVALVEKMMSYGWFRDIYNAASSFHATIMGNDIDELDSWLDSYGKSPIKELRSFAYGIRMDLKAVRNAITLDTSNGIVEGFVNKLKTVKRVMFGRASLDLLKRKMVFSDVLQLNCGRTTHLRDNDDKSTYTSNNL